MANCYSLDFPIVNCSTAIHRIRMTLACTLTERDGPKTKDILLGVLGKVRKQISGNDASVTGEDDGKLGAGKTKTLKHVTVKRMPDTLVL